MIRTLLFWPSGPMLRYDRRNRLLHVCDLNPTVNVVWSMKRRGLLILGLRCIWAAIR